MLYSALSFHVKHSQIFTTSLATSWEISLLLNAAGAHLYDMCHFWCGLVGMPLLHVISSQLICKSAKLTTYKSFESLLMGKAVKLLQTLANECRPRFVSHVKIALPLAFRTYRPPPLQALKYGFQQHCLGSQVSSFSLLSPQEQTNCRWPAWQCREMSHWIMTVICMLHLDR